MIEAVVARLHHRLGCEGLSENSRGLRDQAACPTEGSGKTPGSDFHAGHKAPAGQHDENIAYAEAEKKSSAAELAAKARAVSVQLYTEAARVRENKGIIIADPNSSPVPTTRASCT